MLTMVLKTAKLALFLVLSEIIHFSQGERSFISSFHSSGKWNEDEWIEYKDDIPSFNEFTACHWEKIKYFSEQINTVWSYCMYLTKDDPKLRCLEVYYLISSNIGRRDQQCLHQSIPNESTRNTRRNRPTLCF